MSDDESFFKGSLIAATLSLPLWIAIVALVRYLTS